MNQKGEVNLLFVFMIAALSGVLVLCALKLQRSFDLLERRTELFLCVKETEGEMKRYLTFMGRTNWVLKNTDRAKWVMVFIPGLQGLAGETEKAQRALMKMQDLSLIPYLKKLAQLKSQGCPIDPRMLKTPFYLQGGGYSRHLDKTAKLRNEKWTYHYVSLPYHVSVDWNAGNLEALNPTFIRISSEPAARLSSTLSSF